MPIPLFAPYTNVPLLDNLERVGTESRTYPSERVGTVPRACPPSEIAPSEYTLVLV